MSETINEFTRKEKNFHLCACCFRCEPTLKEFAKWLDYRYKEYVMETGGFSTMDSCSTTPTFSAWLEKNKEKEPWKMIPLT